MQLRRRREKRTDYRKRLALLKSGKPRLVVRKSLNAVHLQLVEYAPSGDRTLAEISSTALKKYGWRCHCGNVPAAYLAGMLIALKCGHKEAVADTGLFGGECIMAAILGAKQGGLAVEFNAKLSKDRVTGKHIAEYAKKIAGTDKYKKQFSAYIAGGLKPEDIEKNFEEAKNAITKEFGKVKEEAVV